MTNEVEKGLAMTNDSDTTLQHFGVKGMKWGETHVSKTSGSSGGSSGISSKEQKKQDKADNKWVRQSQSAKKQVQVYNAATNDINRNHVRAFNDKWDKTGKPFNDEYINAYSKMAESVMQKHADQIMGPSSGSGKFKVKVSYNAKYNGFPIFDVVSNEVKHADEVTQFIGVTDTSGKILRLKPFMGNKIQHSNEIDDFLAHHGVKGMKWGVVKEHQARVNNLNRKLGAAEDHAGDVHAKAKAENRAKGMGRVEAGRKAFNDPRYKRAEAKARKADDAVANEYRSRKDQVKNEQAKLKSRYKSDYLAQHSKGALFVRNYITAGMDASMNYQRSAGYSRGATIATSLLAGPVGNVAAAKIATRRAKTED